jgi:competence protein ComEC
MPFILAAFVGGVFLLQQQALLPSWPAIGAVLGTGTGLLALAWVLAQRRAPWTLYCAIAGAALLGFGHAAGIAALRLADELAWHDEGRDVRVTGVIASLPAQLERGVRFEFAVEGVDTPGIHVPPRVALSWYGREVRVVPAERWTFTVRLRRPHGSFNPGLFDLEVWMLERGLRATGYVRGDPVRTAEQVNDIGPLIDRVRYRLREALQQRLKEQRYGGVLVALVLGDQRAIGADDWALFNQSGIAHLVSISGLHITMIAGLAAWLASALWRRSRRALALAPAQTVAAVAAVLCALAYCLLAGWGVPAQRTFLMLAVVALALLARRTTRTATTLTLAAAAVCALDPWAVIAPGFWLSFGAVAAILWVMSGRTAGRTAASTGWRHKVLDAARAQLAVTVALVPLTMALFAQISLVSPLANAVAIPVVSLLVTPLALLAAAFVMLPEPLAAVAVPLLAFAHSLFAALAEALRALVQLPAAALPWPAPPAWALVSALLGVAWLLAPRGWPARWVGVLWLLPVAAWPPPRPLANELWVTAFDVGQGTAVLVETSGAALLYDTGPRYTPQSDAGQRIIAPVLRRRGIGRLELMVVSHLDSDHSGGAASVMKEIRVGRLLSSVEAGSVVIAGAARTERCEAGQYGDLGPARWRMLHPAAADYGQRRSTNAMSCVMQIEMNDQRILLTGDLPAEQEHELLARDSDLRAVLITAPHHGSRHSSSEQFLAATRPQWVVYTAGYRNRFGHPHPDVVQRYDRAGAQAARTDEDGAVTWRFAGSGEVSVHRARLVQARYWHNRPLGKERNVEAMPAGGDDASETNSREPVVPEVER